MIFLLLQTLNFNDCLSVFLADVENLLNLLSSSCKSCPAPRDPMGCSTPAFPVLCHRPGFAQTHVCWVSDAIQSSHPLLPPSLPALNLSHIRVFPMSWLFSSGGQSIGASTSASVLPMNIQGWFPLRLTGLIFLLSRGLSRVFSSTTVWKHQSSVLSLLYGPTLTSIRDYWKKHSFHCTDLCQESDISAFYYTV